MANLLTRVPSAPPPLDRIQLQLLPIADAVMALMWSRPGGLSLRTTWVTPATVWLGLAVSVPAGFLGIVAIAYGFGSGRLVAVVIGAVVIFAAAAIGTVSIYGIRQRLLARG